MFSNLKKNNEPYQFSIKDPIHSRVNSGFWDIFLITLQFGLFSSAKLDWPGPEKIFSLAIIFIFGSKAEFQRDRSSCCDGWLHQNVSGSLGQKPIHKKNWPETNMKTLSGCKMGVFEERSHLDNMASVQQLINQIDL